MVEITMLNLNMRSKNLVIIGLFLAYIITCIIALCLGDENLSPKELLSYAFGENEILRQIIIDGRLPRIIMAILIGMLLASSGAVTQNVFSNPIADPYIIGIASAAAFGATLAFMLDMADYYYGILGFVCSCVFSLLVFKIASRASLATLLIIGVSAATFLGSISAFLSYVIGEESFKITAWLMGYLGVVSYLRVFLLSLALLFCLGFFYYYKNELNIILSGDEEALSMGVNALKLKRMLLIVSSIASWTISLFVPLRSIKLSNETSECEVLYVNENRVYYTTTLSNELTQLNYYTISNNTYALGGAICAKDDPTFAINDDGYVFVNSGTNLTMVATHSNKNLNQTLASEETEITIIGYANGCVIYYDGANNIKYTSYASIGTSGTLITDENMSTSYFSISNNYVYKVIFNSSGIQFEQVTLSSLFENVE